MLGGLIVDFGGVLTDPGDGDGTERPLLSAVAHARTRGVRTALLSNADGLPTELAPLFDADGSPTELAPLFDTLVFSGDVGFGKPDPRIYLLTAERIGLVPEQCVFVDDLASNVRGAVRAGMVGVHHTAVDSTLTELSALFGFAFPQ
ncbi:MAG TPA: HAD-IA family hydrolase [Pseudonocardiaceae bacterium]|nr:HAD-IA family hydrolase [Pseudonocardiaceae bacterium]